MENGKGQNGAMKPLTEERMDRMAEHRNKLLVVEDDIDINPEGETCKSWVKVTSHLRWHTHRKAMGSGVNEEREAPLQKFRKTLKMDAKEDNKGKFQEEKTLTPSDLSRRNFT